MGPAVLRAFAHRHEVVHLLYAAADEDDASRRLAALLGLDEVTIAVILDQPLRNLLPEYRAQFETVTAIEETAPAPTP